jgi:coenzyme Q-binding protein COQ10
VTVIHRSALVPYSASEMYALVADISSYPKFLPWCGGARILSQDEDALVASIDITYGGMHKTFTTRNLLQHNKMMEIRLVGGPFSRLDGYWRFGALDDQSCKVVLDLEFEVSKKMVAMVLNPVFTNIANQLIDSFHRRAVVLYGPRS